MTSNALQTLMPELMAMKPEEVKTPAIPVEVYVQEALDLKVWAADDKAQLMAAGLSEAQIDSLALRSEACREAQSQWAKVFKSAEMAEQEWAADGAAGYQLRDRMLQAFRYAFRKSPELLSRVALIAEGSTNDDMIQDLSDLAVLGKANLPLLQAIRLPATLLDEAEKNAARLGELLAGARAAQAATPDQLDLRNRSYTFLKEAVDEVRACGKYVFASNEHRLKGYRSEFVRKYNLKLQKGKTEDNKG